MTTETTEKKVYLSVDYDGCLASTAMDQAVIVINHVVEALHYKIAHNLLLTKQKFQKILFSVLKISLKIPEEFSFDMSCYFTAIANTAREAAQSKANEMVKDAVKNSLEVSSEEFVAIIYQAMSDFFNKKQLADEIVAAIFDLLPPRVIFSVVKNKLGEAIDDACDKGLRHLNPQDLLEQQIKNLLLKYESFI